jgi:beta-glucanase (GH16 family)
MNASCIVVAGLVAIVCIGAAPAPQGLDLSAGFNVADRVEDRGASARVVEVAGAAGLRLDFRADGEWPGAFIKAPAGRWNLSDFDRVQMDVENPGKESARVMLRVDNPGADGQRNCNTDGVTVAAGQRSTLTVTFGKSWGGAGFAIDPSNIVGLLVFLDHPKAAQSLVISNVRAAGQVVDRPDWVGQRPPVPGDWRQTLNENFDGEKLNTNLWNTRLNWDGPLDDALQAYAASEISVGDGMLKIAVEKKTTHQYDDPKLPTRPYASAIITTYDKFTQRYGYFEALIKMPTARGLWPAFWMMPDRGPQAGEWWRRASTSAGANEVDIMEHLTEWGPGRYSVATHWDGYGKDHKSWGNSQVTYERTRDGYHAFGLLWEPGRMTFYCDGEKEVTWESDKVSNVPTYLKLCVQMGGWATKNVDDTALPDAMLVDYVRVWQRADLAGKQ